MVDKFEAIVSEYVIPLVEELGGREIRRQDYGIGEARIYQAGELIIRVEDDRGLINLEIAPLSNPNSLHSVTSFRDILAPPRHGLWNMGIIDQVAWFRANRNQVIELLKRGSA